MTHLDTYELQRIAPYARALYFTPEDFLTKPTLAQFLAFNGKDEYLAWRAEWKTAYKELSDRIRTLRKEWRAEGQQHDLQRHHALHRSRDLARAMLALRAASKQRAGEQYRAAKESSQAVA